MILKPKIFCSLQTLIGRYYHPEHQTKRNIKNKYSNLVYKITDNLVAEASDVMSPALDFGLPKTAQYVTDRRHVNYFPSGTVVIFTPAPQETKILGFTLQVKMEFI